MNHFGEGLTMKNVIDLAYMFVSSERNGLGKNLVRLTWSPTAPRSISFRFSNPDIIDKYMVFVKYCVIFLRSFVLIKNSTA